MICSANQWNGFYIIETSVMKELKLEIELKKYLRPELCLKQNMDFLNWV